MDLFLGLDRKLSDVDNLAKKILDLMKNIVYTDDKTVRHIDILRTESDIGQITIIIRKYESKIYRYGPEEDALRVKRTGQLLKSPIIRNQ